MYEWLVCFRNQGNTPFSNYDDCTMPTTGIYAASLQQDIDLFPNPARDQLKIRYHGNTLRGGLQYQLVALPGNIVRNGVLEREAQLNVQNLAPGMYQLRIRNNEMGTGIFKVVVSR